MTSGWNGSREYCSAIAMSETTIDSILEKAVEGSHVRNGPDAVVIALHASLLSEGYDCIAIGDENFGVLSKATPIESLSSASAPSLPSGWNSSQDVYALQYSCHGSQQRCLVKVIPLGDELLVNIMSSDNLDNVLTVSLSVSRYVRKEWEGPPSAGMFRNLLQLFSTLNKEIVGKINQRQPPPSRTSSKQTEHAVDPLMVEPPTRRAYPPVGDYDPLADPSPFAFGSGDLSPFGGPGGMLMDPFRQGGGLGRPRPVGPGFHPPGARYDPVGPFGPPLHLGPLSGRSGGRPGREMPDPDHLPPPGFHDDMFS